MGVVREMMHPLVRARVSRGRVADDLDAEVKGVLNGKIEAGLVSL